MMESSITQIGCITKELIDCQYIDYNLKLTEERDETEGKRGVEQPLITFFLIEVLCNFALSPGIRPISRGYRVCWKYKESVSCGWEASFVSRRGTRFECLGWRILWYWTKYPPDLDSSSPTHLTLSYSSLIPLTPYNGIAYGAFISVYCYYWRQEQISWERYFQRWNHFHPDISHHWVAPPLHWLVRIDVFS